MESTPCIEQFIESLLECKWNFFISLRPHAHSLALFTFCHILIVQEKRCYFAFQNFYYVHLKEYFSIAKMHVTLAPPTQKRLGWQ